MDDIDYMAEITRLNREIQEQQRRIDAVLRIAGSLNTIQKVEDLLREALCITLDVAESEAGSILLYKPEKKKLVFEYVVGSKEKELTGMELEPDQGIVGTTFRSGQTSVYDDVNKNQSHLKFISEKVGYETVSMVTVALKSPDRSAIGAMQILNKRTGSFSRHDVELIELMAAEIALAIENARLREEARLAIVMRFIGDISHDIKNMVTPAISGADTLKVIADECFEQFDHDLQKLGCEIQDTAVIHSTMDELRSVYPEMIEMILASCEAVMQRMAEISSAIKGVISKPNFEDTDILSVARRVVHILTNYAQKKGISLQLESECEYPRAVVDSKQIYNAMYNLILNAIDACSMGDTVTMFLECRLDGVFPDGDLIAFECRDTGPGMTEEVKTRLFTDQAISTKPMGTGLGTRIIKNVVDAHGGTIKLESELGKGTSIRCTIPARSSLLESDVNNICSDNLKSGHI